MSGTPKRLLRLIAAAAFMPIAAVAAYAVALYMNGDPNAIDNNGSGAGVLLAMASVFVTSRIAAREQWSERAAVSLGLSAAFFLLSWVEFGDPSAGPDSAPHMVWYGLCVIVFTPAVVLIPASQWAWSTLRLRRGMSPVP